MSKAMIKSEFTDPRYNNGESITAALKFVNSAKKIARTMANNYNQKKKAYEASQTSFHQHGSLDISRIHSYRTSDDIFRKSVITKEGASHGLVCSLDFSVSMAGILDSVAMQFLITSLFCKYIKIDFQFFSWTSERRNSHNSMAKGLNKFPQAGHDYARFVNIGDNSMSESMLIETFYHILSLQKLEEGGNKFSSEYRNYIRKTLGDMNSTPLLAALYQSYLLAHEMKERGIQNVNILTINDGDNNCYFLTESGDRYESINSIESPFSRRLYTISSNSNNNNNNRLLVSLINKMTRDDGIKTYNMFLNNNLMYNNGYKIKNCINSYKAYHDGEFPVIKNNTWKNINEEVTKNLMVEIKNLCFYDSVLFVDVNMFPKLSNKNEFDGINSANAVNYIASRANDIKKLTTLGTFLSDLMVSDFKIMKK